MTAMTDEHKDKEDKNVHTERIFVTAEMARKWLRQNIENNRPINEGRVNDYARDMKAGRWKENGDTVKFAEGGVLIDGQHRLRASMQCGAGFWSLVAYGIKKEALLTIDRNQVRSTGQILHMSEGVTDYNVIASTITWLWRFHDGIMLATRTPTTTEASEILAEHVGIKDSVAAARRVTHRFKAGSTAVVAVCHYLFTRQDATLAEAFFDALATGAHLREVDPVYQLRTRIITANASTTKRIGSYELIALYFKAWVAEREQRTMSLLKWSTAETYPNIGPIDGAAKKRPDKIEKAKEKKAMAAAAGAGTVKHETKLDALIAKSQAARIQ